MDFFLSLHDWSDVGLLALRVVVAAIFFVHGKAKWAMLKKPAPGTPPNSLLPVLRLLAITEPLGAAAMLFGFFTQLAAVGLGVIMLGAIYFKVTAWQTGFKAEQTTGWEFDLLIFASAFLLYFTGAGAYAFDRVLFGL